MKPLKITLKNYRNVPIDSPITFEIKEGITFVLGPNNVGKTNLLKALVELKKLFQTLLGTYAAHLSNHINMESIYYDQIVNRKNIDQPIFIDIESEDAVIKVQLLPVGNDAHTTTFKLDAQYAGPAAHLKDSLRKLMDFMYVGSLRTGRGTVSASGPLHDIKIGGQFISEWNAWSAGSDVVKRERTSQLVEELKVLFSYEKFSIKVNSSISDLLITTDDGEFDLAELGDGIGHYIVVAGNALIRNPGFIFIDEPEINMHPKMQELFVRTLASKAQHGLIASTHSVGLARSAGDYIYSLTKGPDRRLRLAPFGQHYNVSISQSISELGYSQFVEIGGNNILLVEGRTDIKAFREILRKYDIEKDFIILSLGGKDFIAKSADKVMDELAEIKRLNPKSISVIFDSERSATNEPLKEDLAGFEQICKNLGFSVFATDLHSTESYISQDAVDKIAPSKHALSPFEPFDKRWPKEKNWLMFREMRQADFDRTELGAFIRKFLEPASQKNTTENNAIVAEV